MLKFCLVILNGYFFLSWKTNAYLPSNDKVQRPFLRYKGTLAAAKEDDMESKAAETITLTALQLSAYGPPAERQLTESARTITLTERQQTAYGPPAERQLTESAKTITLTARQLAVFGPPAVRQLTDISEKVAVAEETKPSADQDSSSHLTPMADSSESSKENVESSKENVAIASGVIAGASALVIGCELEVSSLAFASATMLTMQNTTSDDLLGSFVQFSSSLGQLGITVFNIGFRIAREFAGDSIVEPAAASSQRTADEDASSLTTSKTAGIDTEEERSATQATNGDRDVAGEMPAQAAVIVSDMTTTTNSEAAKLNQKDALDGLRTLAKEEEVEELREPKDMGWRDAAQALKTGKIRKRAFLSSRIRRLFI